MSRWSALILLGMALAMVFISPSRAGPTNWPRCRTVRRLRLAKVPASSAGAIGKTPDTGRGHGFYISLSRFILVWILFILWVKTADWVSQDCVRLDMSYTIWNGVMFGPFVAAFLLFWLLPWFEVAYPLLALSYLVPFGVYVIVRNKGVEQHQRVLTPDHLRHVFAALVGKVGVKVAAERQMDYEKRCSRQIQSHFRRWPRWRSQPDVRPAPSRLCPRERPRRRNARPSRR